MTHSYWKGYIPKLVLRLLFITLAGFQFNLYAQTPEIDSLEQQLSNMPEDTNKVQTYIRISYAHWARSDFELAKSYLKDGLSIATKLGNQALMGDIYHRMSVVDWYRGDFQEGLYNTNQALQIHKTLNNKWRIGGGYTQIGNINKSQGNYTEALKYYLISLKIFEENNFPVDIATTYTNIASIYAAQDNQKLAIENSLAAIKIYEEYGHKEGMMANYSNIANVYGNLGEIDKALTYYSAALKLSQETGNRYRTLIILSNIGATYEDDKLEYDKATPYYEEAMQLSREIADSISIGRCYFLLGKNNTNLSNYDLARTYLTESITIFKKYGLKDELHDAYKAYVKLDTLFGNYQLALTHYKQYVAYRDSLSDEAHNKLITEMSVKFETEKKDKEIQKLEDDKRIRNMNSIIQQEELFRIQEENCYNMQQVELLDKEKEVQQLEISKKDAENLAQRAETDAKRAQLSLLEKEGHIQDIELRKQKLLKNYFLGGFILLGLLSFFIYKNYITGHALKLQTLRNKIANDLHDDVGSTLSSIAIFSEMAQQQSKETIPMLNTIHESSRKMLDAMADIVWTINPENDQFEKIIMRMRNFAYELLGAKKIDFQFTTDEEASQIKLPMEVRKNLYLIFKEATNNLVKYSEASKAQYSITKERNEITMLIRDNGKGFDIHSTVLGNGLNSMRKRAEEMGGKLILDSHPGQGTSIMLKIAV